MVTIITAIIITAGIMAITTTDIFTATTTMVTTATNDEKPADSFGRLAHLRRPDGKTVQAKFN